MIWTWWKNQRLRPTPIRDLSPGTLAKVAGNVLPHGEVLLSPFTGIECVFYRVIVTRDGIGAMGQRGPQLADDVEEGQTFLLEDTSGVVLVNRMGAADMWVSSTPCGGDAHAQNFDRFRQRVGAAKAAFFDGFSLGGVHYREETLRVGARATVIGRARESNVQLDRDYRTAGRVLELVPPDDQNMKVTETTA